VNITRIESRPVTSNKFDFYVDFDGQVGSPNVNQLLNVLKGMTDKLLVLDEKEVSSSDTS
jgi:prephenate dehydratase